MLTICIVKTLCDWRILGFRMHFLLQITQHCQIAVYKCIQCICFENSEMFMVLTTANFRKVGSFRFLGLSFARFKFVFVKSTFIQSFFLYMIHLRPDCSAINHQELLFHPTEVGMLFHDKKLLKFCWKMAPVYLNLLPNQCRWNFFEKSMV